MHWSKEFLRDELTERVKLLGGEIHRLPKSDCYEILVNGEERLFVSLKDSYKKDGKLWVGIPNPLLSKYEAANGRTRWLHEHAVIILIHVPKNALLFIPIKSVLNDRNQRESYHKGFNIEEMTGYKKYVIKTLDVRKNIPVEVIDDLGKLEELIKVQSLPKETTSMSNAGRHDDGFVAEHLRRKRAVEEQEREAKAKEEEEATKRYFETLSPEEIRALLSK